MSERQPNPEKRKGALTDKCDKCGEKYRLTPENTVLLHYTVDSQMDNLICNCTNCKHRTRIFIGSETFEQAVSEGIHTSINKYAHPAVVTDYEELYEIKRVETYQLTDRLEKVMGNAALVFNRTPDEHLYDLITDTGYGKPHAIKWND